MTKCVLLSGQISTEDDQLKREIEERRKARTISLLYDLELTAKASYR